MEVPNYVMVPIPETLVPRVMEHVLHLMAKDAIKQWDVDGIRTVLHEQDETTKAVLSAVARNTIADEETSTDELSQSLGLSISDLVGRVQRVNESGFDQLRPAVAGMRAREDVLPSGRSVRKRVIDMTEHVATLIQMVEAEERAASPHHLQASGD